MEIIDILGNKRKEDVNFEFVENSRIILCGPTGCGKTMLMANYVLKYAEFEQLYLWSKHLDDPKDVYCKLQEIYEKLEKKIRKKMKDENIKILYTGDDLESLPSVEEIPYEGKKLVVIDDFINEKNKEHLQKLEELFTSGRHRNCQVIYMSQSYQAIPKKLRENADYFLFWRLRSKREIQEIAKFHAVDIPNKTFQEIFKDATSEPYKFLLVDKKTPHFCMRYRKGFNGLLELEEDDE